MAAHPDDEVIGAGSRLPYCGATVVHVTDGAAHNMQDAIRAGFTTRTDYARARRSELLAALGLAGVSPERAMELGVPDQEASANLERVASDLAELLRQLEPEIVITHPYEGGHPDHDSTAFAVRAAATLLERRSGLLPEVVEMTSYHDRDGWMEVGEFLPGPGEISTVVLSDGERELKERMLACFTTQRQVLKAFPVESERFRPAPVYDFTRPPHTGTLYYERFDWGMTGGRWRYLAESAMKTLGLEQVACGSRF